MKQQMQAIYSELLKIRRTPISWLSFVLFALGPVMGGLIFFLMKNTDMLEHGSALSMKAEAMGFGVDWSSYFSLLSQVVGVGGIIIFGFVISWLFGREYMDKTFIDLLALPVSRSKIINAKFVVYLLWCLALVCSNLLLGLIIGAFLGLGGWSAAILLNSMTQYFLTSLLVAVLGPPVAFVALWGRGFMAPIGFVIVTMIFAQIIGAIGFGHYFPWALPGLYSGSAGDYALLINNWSYFILGLLTLVGFAGTHWWWNTTDQA